MDIIQIIVLAIVQGITEFLPISSSAHLILPAKLLGWQDQGIAFDVAVHVGSLAAVLWYFRKDVGELFLAWCTSLSGSHSAESRLAWYVIVATIPACVFGLLAESFIESHLRSLEVIAATTFIFGALLWWADRKPETTAKSVLQMTLVGAVVIGLFQALALIPGTSRSGITITAALLLGFARQDAAKFSFLLSIPIILASGLFEMLELFEYGSVAWVDLGLGAVLSGISAYACIHLFLKFIERIGMLPFVIYRFVLASALLAFVFI